MAGGKSGLIKLMVLFCKINTVSGIVRWKPKDNQYRNDIKMLRPNEEWIGLLSTGRIARNFKFIMNVGSYPIEF